MLVCTEICWAAGAAAQQSYEVQLTTELRAAMRGRVEAVSKLFALLDKPPASLLMLRRRAQGDVEAIGDLLRSEGFYDAEVSYRVEERQERPPLVELRIEAGEPYRLGSFRAFTDGPLDEEAERALARWLKTISTGQRLRAENVAEAEDRLISLLAENGYPRAEAVSRRARLDRGKKTGAVTVTVVPGPLLAFGDARISGTDRVRAEYVRRRVPWKVGQRYDARLLETLRRRLRQTGMFSSVTVRPAANIEAGLQPVLVRVEEGRARSVEVGVRYDSSSGAGASAFWEHRNLRGAAERLRIGGDVAELGQSGRIVFRHPDFLTIDQALLLDASYEIRDTDAFRSEAVRAFGGVERQLGEAWALRGGLSFDFGPVEGFRQDRTFTLVGVPLALGLDTTDDVLNPTRGNRLEATLVSYPQGLGSQISFFSSRLSDAFYLAFDRRRRLVAAVRVAAGSISGSAFADIPADKRFYAGGGGSVRGYAFQHAGPLDADGDPIGGRSIVELGAELRWRLGDRFGVVPFVDGGNVFEQVLPSFDGGLFWGAGLGLRYYSGAGPIRLDFAIPLNRRVPTDDSFQLYVSLGQAF